MRPKWAKVVFTLAMAVPITCELISRLGNGPGPMIPYPDATGPTYLDFFNALGIATALLLLIPGAIAAYKGFGRVAAVIFITWTAVFAWVFSQQVWWS
jgi:hypothetical protein